MKLMVRRAHCGDDWLRMKVPAALIVLIGSIQLTVAGLVAFEEADAVAAVEGSEAVFEAKPVEVEKVIRLGDGTVVTEEGLAKLERPHDSAQKVVTAKLVFDVEFEIVRVYKGAVKVGERFRVKWEDKYDSRCPHRETMMVDEEVGVWGMEGGGEGEAGKYVAYPRYMGERVREVFGPGGAIGN
ncbi:MAG: hypothetical protein AAF591_19895 [Verrucomicrobiota bacterium]